MAKPVIFDDGGSIRIRELDDNQTMDSLIGSPNGFASASSQQFFGNGSANNRCLLMVTSIGEDGTLTRVPFNAGTGLYGQALSATDVVVITSSDGQTLTINFVGGVLSIVLSVSASGFQRKKRRRYIMATDIIQNVSLNGASIFDAGLTTPIWTIVSFQDLKPHTVQIRHEAIL